VDQARFKLVNKLNLTGIEQNNII